jgi:putative DNA primase/helicase
MKVAPFIEDTSHGMWRRLYIINFPHCFSEKEMDVHLTEKLRSELSGIFNWAIEGYKRLKRNNFIFSQGETMQEAKDRYKTESDSVLSFTSQYVKKVRTS